MGRWEPGTAQRLHQAALDLFVEQGFEQTTATEIARAAGVTERTFFRQFSDKRDVLFEGQEDFEAAFIAGIASAPAQEPSIRLVGRALASGSTFFTDDRRDGARQRQQVIDATPSLQERERHKMAGLARAIAAALRDRGVEEPSATLAAEAGVTVFGVAFGQWIAPGERRSMSAIAAAVLDQLVSLAAASPRP